MRITHKLLGWLTVSLMAACDHAQPLQMPPPTSGGKPYDLSAVAPGPNGPMPDLSAPGVTLSDLSATETDSGIATPGVSPPIMGWSSWSFIRRDPTDAKIRAQAKALHDSGLVAHGFRYINVDDFYYVCGANGPSVDGFGRWVVDTNKFPAGMKALGDYIHGQGLFFGLYVTPGIALAAVQQNTPVQGTTAHAQDFALPTVNEKNYNCRHMVGIDYTKPGAQQFINSWANLFASYGVDYIKIDGVGSGDIPDIQAWSQALAQTGRAIHLELSNNLNIADAATWRKLSDGWRISGDVECYGCETGGSSYPLTDWAHVSSRFGQAAKWAQYGGGGHYNDLDSLEIGNGANDGLTPDERQSYVTLWSIAAAPLLLGVDLTNLDAGDMPLLTNDEVLAVNHAGVPGEQLEGGTQQVWAARQGDASYAVALFNLGTVAATVSVSFAQLGITGGRADVRDLWSHTDLGVVSGSFSATLQPNASRMLKVVTAP
jgi:hypothetical protein